MSDLYATYPNTELPFLDEFEHLYAALISHRITTCDLMILTPTELAQLTSRSSTEVKRFLRILEGDISSTLRLKPMSSSIKNIKTTISTGVKTLDLIMDGGIRAGGITEIAGAAATGKSHLLLQLACTVQLPLGAGGLGKRAIYIETESGGPRTQRLQAMLAALSKLPENSSASLSTQNIQVYYCNDIDELVHVLKYQVPVLVEKLNVGLLIVDSIAAFYRGQRQTEQEPSLTEAGKLLRKFANQGLAVVAANQVTDNFNEWRAPARVDDDGGPTVQSEATWLQGSGSKKPALGIVWQNIIDTRIVLHRTNVQTVDEMGVFNSSAINRILEVVFSCFCAPGCVEFQITDNGIRDLDED